MQSSKLVQALQHLSKKEVKKLYEYIQSPFFSVPKEVVKVFDYLNTYLQTQNVESCSKESIFQHLYPNQPYHAPKVNKVISSCLEVFEEFYITYYQKTNDIVSFDTLFSFYERNNLSTHWDGLYRTAQTKIDKLKKDNDYYYQKWELDKLIALREINRSRRQEIKAYYQAIESFEKMFVLEQLKTFCSKMVLKSMFTTIPVDFFETAIVEYIQTTSIDQKDEVIWLYWHIYQGLKGQSNHLYQIMERLPDYFSILRSDEITSIYSFLQSIIVKGRQNPTSNITNRNLFELYRQMVNEGYIYDTNGDILPTMFKNIIDTGLDLQETQWVKDFIEKFQEKLPEDMRQEAASLGLGLLYFWSKEYEETLKVICDLTPSDIFFNIHLRRLTIKTYF